MIQHNSNDILLELKVSTPIYVPVLEQLLLLTPINQTVSPIQLVNLKSMYSSMYNN